MVESPEFVLIACITGVSVSELVLLCLIVGNNEIVFYAL